MGASAFPGLAIPKSHPGGLEKGWKRRENHARMDAAYAKVDARDGGLSRISGRPTVTGTSDPTRLRDHCHIKAKGAHPELKYASSNIFTATRQEHKLFDAYAITLEGTDARGRLIFRWNRAIVPVGKEPFRLLSKRRSQNWSAAA